MDDDVDGITEEDLKRVMVGFNDAVARIREHALARHAALDHAARWAMTTTPREDDPWTPT